MLRSANQSLARNGLRIKNSSWSLYDSAKKSFYSTDNVNAEKKDENIPLSVRLGAGRGKLFLDNNNEDPFASFLASAQKHKRDNNNNQRNGSFTPRNNGKNTRRLSNRKPAEGQFDDAVEASSEKAPRTQQRRPQQQRQREGNNRQRMNNAQDGQNMNSRLSRPKDSNSNSNRKSSFFSTKRKPQEIRQTKETEFEDADDIDWTLLDTTALADTPQTTTSAETAAIVAEGTEAEGEKAPVTDIAYEKYYDIGSSLKWSEHVKAGNINQLIGSNATLDYDQKVAFLSTVAKMTAGSGGNVKAARN